jgi:hypothetical protein
MKDLLRPDGTWESLLKSEPFLTSTAKLASTLAVAVLVLILAVRYESVVKQQLLPRVSKVDVFGLKFELAEKRLDQLTQTLALPKPQNAAASAVPLSDQEKKQILARLKVVGPMLQGSHLLWVDDHPEWQVRERDFLQAIGIGVDCAQTNVTAYQLLDAQKANGTPYELVISDVDRDHEGGETGFTFLNGIRARGYDTDVIFYTTSGAPRPPEALALTNSTSKLLNFVLDVLEYQQTLRLDIQESSPGPSK